jgi:hypothetical protein
MSLLLVLTGSVAPPVPVEVIGGGIGHGGRKKPVFIERDGKVLVFASAAKAASYVAAEKAVEPVFEPVAEQQPVRAKPAEVAARPVETIAFDAIADLLRSFNLAPDITAQIQRHELDAVMALYQRARDLQDEEDIELLLLAA